jgi:hypothetical protein
MTNLLERGATGEHVADPDREVCGDAPISGSMARVTVPPGVRPPPYERRGNFETIEVQPPIAPVAQPVAQPPVLPVVPPVEAPAEPEERSDIAVIGPIAALVLVLTICTLILDHPAARAVATGLATLGLVVAVVLMLMAKKPKPGRHVARHAVDPEATDRIPPGWNATDRRR